MKLTSWSFQFTRKVFKENYKVGEIWCQDCENPIFPYYKYDIIVNTITGVIHTERYWFMIWTSNVETVKSAQHLVSKLKNSIFSC